MTRPLWALLGAALGYALRRPMCQKVHVEMRHLAPAIVDRERDEGIDPPDPRTISPTLTGTWPPLTVTSTHQGVTTAPDMRWPETLSHDEALHLHPDVGRLRWALGCRRCAG